MNLPASKQKSAAIRHACEAGLRFGLIPLLWLGWDVIPAQAQPLCSNQWIVVRPVPRADRVDFYLDNKHTAEISVHFKVASVNLRSSETFPLTRVIPGSAESFRICTLRPSIPSAKWSYKYDLQFSIGNYKARHQTNHHYRLPFASNAGFKVIQGFNGRPSHFGENQYAIDWGMPEGTPVHAARKGLVVAVKDDSKQGGPDLKYDRCANVVMIQHSDGTMGQYLHLRQKGAAVALGQIVREGDLIGYSGNTGYSHGPHLHFDVFKSKDGQARESLPILFDTDQGKGIVLKSRRTYRHPGP